MNSVLNVGVLLKGKDLLSPKISTANKSLTKFDAKIKQVGTSMLKIGAAGAAVGTAILAPMKSFYTDFTDIAKKEGELESLGIGAKGIASITEEAKKFTNQFARVSAPEFLNSAYDIKSGISSLSDTGVAKMTALSSMTAQATKATGQEMSKLFALGYGIFGKDFKNDFDFGEKFSAAISTSVQAFRTDGADLALGLSNIGAAAKSMGVSLEEELAIVGVGKSIFNSASEAGTGYRAFLTGVGSAQEKLGLKFTDSHGKMLPIVDILEKIRNKYEDLESVETKDLLKEAFGSDEATKLIAGLITKTDELSEAQRNLRTNMDKGIQVTEKMAKSMNKGYGVELMTNRLVNLTSTIGKQLNPMITKITSKIGDIAMKARTWMTENEELSASIVKWVAIGGTALVVGGGLLMTFGLIAKAVPLATVGIKALGLAFVPVGVAALALAFLAPKIIEHWTPIKTFFGGFFEGLKAGFTPVISSFSDFFSVVGKAYDGILSLFNVSKETTTSLEEIGSTGKRIGEIIGTVFKVILRPIEMAVWTISRVIELTSKIGKSIISFFGFGDEKSVINPKTPTKIVAQESKKLLSRRDRRNRNMSQNVNISKIEINNPTSTVEVEKGIANGMARASNSYLDDEEF